MKFTEEKQSNGGSGSGKYIKIADGETLYCMLRGDIKVNYARWTGSKYESCPKGAEGAGLRFRVNAIVAEDKKPVAKILEGGGHLYFDLKNINEEYPLDQTMIKISRTGEQKNTRYTVMVAGPKAQPDEATMKAIQAVELLPLDSNTKATTPVDTNDVPGFDDNEEIPF